MAIDTGSTTSTPPVPLAEDRITGPRDASVARRRERRPFRGLPPPSPGGRGRARRRPPHPGDPGTRPGGALELQGRQVRLVQRRDQRPAAPDVHDADEHAPGRRAHHDLADARLSRSCATSSPTSRTTSRWPSRSPPSSPGRRRPTACYRMAQVDIDRGQEFHKCIECFLCQNVCHVIRDHEENKPRYAGPRFFVRLAELEMHPLDTLDRRELIRERDRHRALQHHQVLHRGLPGGHPHHRQRHHPAERARRRRELRPGRLARPQDRPTAGSAVGRGSPQVHGRRTRPAGVTRGGR